MYDPNDYIVKQYNPEKAGAVIVDCFDITDKIVPLEKSQYGHITIKQNYDLAEYNNSIYIRIKQILYVFDKSTMEKRREIAIYLPAEYDFLPTINDPFYSPANGLVVIDSNAFVLFIDNRRPHKVSLFIVDLDTGNAEYINEEILGVKFNDGRLNLMGYDKQKNAIWFRFEDYISEVKGVYFYFFQYDNDTKTFTKTDETIWDFYVDRADFMATAKTEPPRAHIITSSIYGNESWNVYVYMSIKYGEKRFLIVDKRNVDSLTETICQINAEHLGTLSLPQSIIYDKPYLWMMVEREGRIQMLKLLPNE